MVQFSQLKGSCVYDSEGACIGKLMDLVFVDGTVYAEITHLIYQDENKYKKKIPWTFVKEFKEENEHVCINLNSAVDEITPFFMKQKEVLVGEILDKQVVDVSGVKIVRVNDILLGKVDTKFCIVAVCVGATSFVKRLGLGKFTGIASSKIKEHIIPWKSVERLEPEFHDLHLKMQKEKIADLHAEDIADIMEDLSHNQRILLFNSIDKIDRKKAAKTLIKAEEGVQDTFLKSFKMTKIKELLENIPQDQAADIISLMPSEKGEEILCSMSKETASKIRRILNYFPEVIGAIMKTDFIAVPENYTAQKTINLLRKIKPPSDRIYHIYVTDKDKRLVGVLSIRGLLTANPKSKVMDYVNKKIVFVRDNDLKETAVRLMARYDIFVLPVVDKENVLRGIVKSDDMLTYYIPKKQRREKFLPLKLRNKQNGFSKN